MILENTKSIRSQMFSKIGILKNFEVFTGKHYVEETPTQMISDHINDS